ncbi:MAG: 50S ribosomal protein L24 [Rickettsiaceae bacterium]|nr:50S ribosomal protein L24 [Rickettsiaceae bacterium]
MNKLKIKKGDKVILIAGKDKGFTGEVLKVFPKELKVIVAGANLARRHTKPTREKEGGIISKEMPLSISNVAILDPQHNKATKVGFKFLEDGSKVRYAKLSGQVIDLRGK